MTQPVMKNSNGVIKIDRKGRKKFAFGDAAPFEIDVVQTWDSWLQIDSQFREQEGPDEGTVRDERRADYHQAAVTFVEKLSDSGQNSLTLTEALEFIRLLREQYEDLATFFRYRSRTERESPASSEVELRFSAEENSPPSTN